MKGLGTTLLIASGKLRSSVFPPPRPAGTELRLHLGCGPVNHPAFVNVDGYPYRHVHHVRRIDDLAPFPDGSAVLVYACHCLEHFLMADLPRVLGEWCRVLQPGGTLRLSVPDFDRLLSVYAAHDANIAAISEPLLGGQDSLYNFHYSVFTMKSLTRLLEMAGLHDVRRWTPGSSQLTTFDDWSSRSIVVNGESHHISLNVEATK